MLGGQQKPQSMSMAASSKESAKEKLPEEFEELPEELKTQMLERNRPNNDMDWNLLVINWMNDF